MEKIEWSDLELKVSEQALIRAYMPWADVTGLRVKPLFVSVFGDLFYVSTNQEVQHLDLVQLQSWSLGITESQFGDFINNAEIIRTSLRAEFVVTIKSAGVVREPQQVYALVPHPVVSGELSPERVMVMDLFPWSNICRQLYDSGHGASNSQM